LSVALRSVAELDEDEYLEVPAACTALAAAEVLAALLGRPSEGLPPDVARWVSEHSSHELVSLTPSAVTAVRRVLENSELQECWDDTGDSTEWRTVVASLISRLGGRPPDVRKTSRPRSEERNQGDYGPTNILARKLKELSFENAHPSGLKDGEAETRSYKLVLVSKGKAPASKALEGFRQAKLAAIDLLRPFNDFDSRIVAEYVRGWLESSRKVPADE
jgi:hypothetical protein